MSPLRIIYRALPPSRRREIWFTVALLSASAIAETLSIGAILPFLAALTDPDALRGLPVVGGWFASLPRGPGLVASMAALFIALAVLSGLLRLFLSRATQAAAFNVSYDLATTAFSKLLRQEYSFYVKAHSSDLIARFEKLYGITFTVFVSTAQAVVATFLGVMIIALLLVVSPGVALVAAGLLISLYLLVSLFTRPRLKAAGADVNHHFARRIKIVQEALGGVRDILLDRSQPVYEKAFNDSADLTRRAFITTSFLGQAPRMLVETAGFVAIGLYVWLIAGQPGGIAAALPTLGALALGAQRLLPQLQIAYLGWSNATTYAAGMREVADLLDLEDRLPPLPVDAPEVLHRELRFECVGFSYGEGGEVLRDVNLTVARGERIGVAGPTGSGKSTLVDLLLGLLDPTAGRILVDGKPLTGSVRASWQLQVAHVPQSIYLTDGSLAANIAFGVPEAERDMERVREVARQADIATFIDGLPQGYDTPAGERGVRLSGGQRQRIGIARALYHRPRVLVLDEATSALDTATERAVMASIEALEEDMTIIMIAHRLSTLENCDRILRVGGGRVQTD